MTDHSTAVSIELQTLRDACPLLVSQTYLANCSQGPLAAPVRAAIETFLGDWATLGMHWNAWIDEVERARAVFARLIGAEPSEIAVGTSVSQLVDSLASALVAGPPDNQRTIISSRAEFPGVAHAWLATRKIKGWQVELLEENANGTVDTEQFVEAIDGSTALISAPQVCYANGNLLDLDAIIAAAHANGAFVFVDAYQSIGTLPIDVKASQIDFLAAGTLKYLLGTAGIAFMYVNPAVLDQLEPTVTGWFGRTNIFAFDPGLLDYAASAARFDLGTPPIINAYTARAGMELIEATGPARIRQQIERLSAVAYELAPRLGLQIGGPQEIARKGATTAITIGSVEKAHWLEDELRKRAIVVSARGKALRVAPHGFTRADEIERALEAIAQLLHQAN